MSQAYIRCNEGHYFVGEHCPFDGWSSKESKQLAEISKKLTSEGKKLTLKELKENAVSNETLSRTIIVDFGEGNFVFDAFSPDGFMIAGKYLRLPELPVELL